MTRLLPILLLPAMLAVSAPAAAVEPPSSKPSAPAFDAELARRTGADARGMRAYVLVVLKTGPTPLPPGPEREAMFAGHFANMQRLADEGKLVLAGPFARDPDGWRGLFLLAVDDVAHARELAATDPVIAKGEMVAEYHAWYGSAAAMLLPELHAKLAPPTAAADAP